MILVSLRVILRVCSSNQEYVHTWSVLEMQVHGPHPGLLSEDLWAWSQETALKVILCTLKLENHCPESVLSGKELDTFMDGT